EKALVEWGAAVKPELLRVARSGPVAIRARALRALGRIGGADLEPELEPMLKDPEPAVRTQAAAALGEVAGERAVERMAPLLGAALALMLSGAAGAGPAFEGANQTAPAPSASPAPAPATPAACAPAITPPDESRAEEEDEGEPPLKVPRRSEEAPIASFKSLPKEYDLLQQAKLDKATGKLVVDRDGKPAALTIDPGLQDQL